jgi:hypothetical protein
MGTLFQWIGGFFAAGFIWIVRIVLAGALFGGLLFGLGGLARGVGLDTAQPGVVWAAAALAAVMTIAMIFWLQRRARRHGLGWLFDWSPIV